MSFILDALKKSESERQQQQAAEFASVPSGRESPPAPRWLWVLGALLGINVLVVAALVLRPDPPPVPPSAEPPAASAATPAPAAAEVAEPPATSSFADRVADARRQQPAPASALRPVPTAPAPDARGGVTAAPTGTVPPPSPIAASIASLPTAEELQLEAGIAMPPLRLDLHVYNDDPARRLVSINMQNYHENERLAEGPVIREITPEGVILEYEDRRFALLQ